MQARLPWQKRVGQRIRETDKQMGGLFEARERARGRQVRGNKGLGNEVNGDGVDRRTGEQVRELGVRENEQPGDLPESQSSGSPKSQSFDNAQGTFSG